MAKDRYQYFRLEAKDLTEGLGRGLLEIEKGSRTALAEVLRLAHTLKGAAGVVKLPEVARRAHAMEDLLAPHRGGDVPRQAIDQSLALLDEISREIAALDAPPAQPAAPREEAPAAGQPGIDSIRVEMSELDALVAGISEATVQAEALRQALAAAGPRRGDPGGDAGEGIDRRLAASLHRLGRELGDVRERADRLRLLPASCLFSELARAARDAAQAAGKSVSFETDGGEERLDAHVLSELRGALAHLVRNAVVHGIEKPPARLAAGKPAEGRVVLRVKRRGPWVSFQCCDDGGGVDVEAVRRAAVERRMLSEDEARRLSVPETLRLIFSAGLTTAREVDLVSGRGLGLDAVRDAAARLKGRVEARTEAGRGTTLEIGVPVSLTSLELLGVEQGRVRTSLPFAAVRRVLRLRRDQVLSLGPAESISHEGEAVPFRDLAALMGAAGPRRSRAASLSAVLIGSESGLAALGVDRLVGRSQEVIRPLPAAAGRLPLLAGASFDAEGNPQLVLDPSGLVDAIRRKPAAGGGGALEQDRPPILIVDDSLTTRMLEQTILEANGYLVDLATSGEEALQMARKRRYGLMLVDVEMPRMTGFELLQRARLDPELSKVPAILVTTLNSAEDRRRGMEAGARAYLVKSEFDEGLLLQTIRGLIG